MLPTKLITFLLLIGGVPVAIAVGYYYYQEVAPVCTYEYAEQFNVNRYCTCQGFEVEKHNSLDSYEGYRETLCLGQVKEIHCTKVIRGETFETDCEG